jgi:hypothetical protein
MTVTIGRWELLAALGGVAAAWPLAASAQQIELARVGQELFGQAVFGHFPNTRPPRARPLTYGEIIWTTLSRVSICTA